MTTALFLLRVFQTGLRLDDLDGLSTGTVFDIMTEAVNDEHKYKQVASQSDMDKF